jgi:hypothetical protein
VPSEFTYTSKATLDLVAGVPTYPIREGQITAVQFSVAAAPSSAACILDLLIDGASVFDGASKPQIPTGSIISERLPVDTDRFTSGSTFAAGSKIQVQFTQLGGATGPAVVHIEYVTEF